VEFFLITLKIGALAFGGGYAMIRRCITNWSPLRLLTETEFSSAVAVGQITPGPLMIMVAFIGFKIAGMPGRR